MKSYSVILLEDPDDGTGIVFHCMADDKDHAIEQAKNAYPACTVLHVGRL